jgi:hypothetical protein
VSKNKHFQLCEAVCKKCWLGTHGGDDDWWGEADHMEFVKGDSVIACPRAVTDSHAGLAGGFVAAPIEPPPEWCPHKLEHAMGVSLETEDA